MQQFGTPPIRTATKQTFTLTNYYQPLYGDLNPKSEYIVQVKMDMHAGQFYRSAKVILNENSVHK